MDQVEYYNISLNIESDINLLIQDFLINVVLIINNTDYQSLTIYLNQ